jgi:hypothetical protein
MANTLNAPANPILLRRLRRVTTFVRVLIALGGATLVGHVLWAWSSPERALHELTDLTNVSCVDRVTTQAQVLGALFTLLPLGVALAGLAFLWRLFSEYREARIFSPLALHSLTGFARCLFVTAFAAPLYGVALSVILTWVNGPGRREVAIYFSSAHYAMLLLGAVLLAISSVMGEAARVAEDHAGFV